MKQKSLWYNTLIFTLYAEVITIMAIINYMIIENSWKYADPEWKMLELQIDGTVLVGIVTVMAVEIILMFLFDNIQIAMLLSIFFSLVFGITNYYVYKLHGLPFTIYELKNIKTAMNVVGSYSFELESPIINMFMWAGIGVLIIFLTSLLKKKMSYRIPTSIPMVIVFVWLYMQYAGAHAIIPSDAASWSWYYSLMKFGYVPCFTQMTIGSSKIIKEPENYSQNDTISFAQDYEKQSDNGNTPDIILILNESFYNLEQVTNPEPDQEVFQYISKLDDSIQGYAVAPRVGGGTNCSEYELLTSNSLQIIPGVTPFNVISLKNANTINSHLQSLGYQTLACHSESSQNYNRLVAYSDMGFDEIYFQEDFKNLRPYKDRFYDTDECVYENLTSWYDKMGDAPRFLYCLTIQNHGGYEISADENDIVHTTKDYGEFTDDVNEFMTSIYLSDYAFEELVDYYSKVDRDVVICMVGDHSPLFAKEIADEKLDDSEKEVNLMSVPYVIWSNKSNLLNHSLNGTEKMSMVYLAPTVLEAAGVELSGYYDYMVDLRTKDPILGLTTTEEQSIMSKRYFDLEYLNLKNPQKADLFYK